MYRQLKYCVYKTKKNGKDKQKKIKPTKDLQYPPNLMNFCPHAAEITLLIFTHAPCPIFAWPQGDHKVASVRFYLKSSSTKTVCKNITAVYRYCVYLADGCRRNRLMMYCRRRTYSAARNILSRYAETSLSSGSRTNMNL